MTAKTIQTLGAVSAVLFALGLRAEPIVRYVAVGGTGDGTSWENASASLPAMYAEVGANADGGEVRMAAGVYQQTSAIEIQSKTSVSGGWEGDAQSGTTVLYGLSIAAYWKANGTATETPIVDVEKGDVNALPVEGHPMPVSWQPTANGVDYLFRHTVEGPVSDVRFSNLKFACYGKSVIDLSLAGADGLVLSNCAFYACGHGAAALAAVTVAGNSIHIAGCTFDGCCGAVAASGACHTILQGTTISRSYAGWDDGGAGGVKGSVGATFTIDGCRFEDNVARQNVSRLSACMNISGAYTTGDILAVSNTVFCGNYASEQKACGVIRISTSDSAFKRVSFVGCEFVGNTNRSESWNADFGSASIGIAGAGLRLLVANSRFAGNTSELRYDATAYGSCGAALACGATLGGDNFYLVNCTFENNRTVSPGGYGTLAKKNGGNGYLHLINCLFSGNDCFKISTDGQGTLTRVRETNISAGWYDGRITVVNSVFWHAAADYLSIPLEYRDGLANSYLKGEDLKPISKGSHWSGNFFLDNWDDNNRPADPLINDVLQQTAWTARTRGLTYESPLRKKGRCVWQGTDGLYYIHDGTNFRKLFAPGNPGYPYASLTVQQAAEVGVSLTADPLADVRGYVRTKPTPGPIDPRHGLIMLLR